MDQEIRFCRARDGVRIAYATVGSGDPLVKPSVQLCHLEYEWRSPVWRHWWQELSKNHLLVRYDARGCGLSDWSVEDLSFDAWVSDLELVVDTLGLDRFALLGISAGGAVVIEYAVRHPERVSHLVLHGAQVRGAMKLGQAAQEEHEALLALARLGWGRDNPAYQQVFTSRFMPEATTEQMQWLNDLQRISTSPENAVKLRIERGKIDVLDRVGLVTAPALVLHSRGDAVVPIAEGRQAAALMPNAQFVQLESNNHILLESEPAWQTFLSEVRRFLGVQEDYGQVEPQHEMAPVYPDGLSEREAEVLRLVAAGRSNRDIAEALIISPNTVARHVSNIFAKTGCANRAEATGYAHRNGLV